MTVPCGAICQVLTRLNANLDSSVTAEGVVEEACGRDLRNKEQMIHPTSEATAANDQTQIMEQIKDEHGAEIASGQARALLDCMTSSNSHQQSVWPCPSEQGSVFCG